MSDTSTQITLADTSIRMPSPTDEDRGSPEWVMRYLKWMYKSCVDNPDYQLMMKRMLEERLYATGAQNQWKYMPKMGIRGTGIAPSRTPTSGVDLRLASGEMKAGTNASDSSYVTYDWRIVAVMPKAIRNIVARIVKRGYYLTVEANDPESQNAKLRERLMQEARMYAQVLGTAEQFNQSAGQQVIPPDPTAAASLEEVEWAMESFRLPEEEAWEVAINAVLGDNNYGELHEELVRYLVMHRLGIGLERSDGNGRAITEIIDPIRGIYDMGSANYCARHFGHVIPMTPSALREFAGRFGKTWTDDEFKKVIDTAFAADPSKRLTWWNSRPQEYYESWRSGYGLLGPQDSQRVVYVMYGTFYSTIPERWDMRSGPDGSIKPVKLTKSVIETESETYKDDQGRKQKRPREYPNAKEKPIQYVYEGYMIVGTNEGFGCQMMQDMTRSMKPESFAMTTLPYKVVTLAGEVSLVRGAIPLADGIQVLFLQRQKFQQMLAPEGVAINQVSVIEAFTQQDGRSPHQAWENALDMYFQTNSVKHSTPNGATQPPIVPIPARGVVPLQVLDQTISFRLQELEAALGLNDATSGATPDSKALVGTLQFAAQSTENALEEIVNGGVKMTRLLCEGIYGRLQVFARTNGLERYTLKVNEQKRRIIMESALSPLTEIGLNVSASPNPKEMEGFFNVLQSSMTRYRDSNGRSGIPEPVYLQILECKSPKQQRAILERSLRKTDKETQEREAASIQANTQAQMQSAQQAEQIKQSTLQLEYQLKGQHEQMMAAFKADEFRLSLQAEAEKSMREMQARLIELDREMQAEANLELRLAIEQRRTEMMKLIEQRRTDLLLADKKIEEMKARPKPVAAGK